MTNNLKEIEKIVNPFIDKWVSEHYGHLVDTDENDGERLRQKLLTLINQKEKEARIEELKHLTSGSEYSADDIDWYEKEYDGSRYYYSEVPHINIKARIKQLKEELKEDV